MNLTIAEYTEMSVYEGLSDGEIAKKINYSPSHLSNWKRKHDLVHRSTDDLDWEIVEALKQTKSLRWIARKYDMEWKTFWRWYTRNENKQRALTKN